MSVIDRTIPCVLLLVVTLTANCHSAEPEPAPTRTYNNRLRLLQNPPPLLADYPQFVAPVRELRRFEAAPIVTDEHANLSVRAWRFSYNARGIIEMPNHLKAAETAVIMVHPWGIDDGQGWDTPQPAGVADFCTIEKNHLAAEHTRSVINPLLKRLRGRVQHVMYSLPGSGSNPRCFTALSGRSRPPNNARPEPGSSPGNSNRSTITASLCPPLPLSKSQPVIDYFRQFPGLDAGPRYNNAGFWNQRSP